MHLNIISTVHPIFLMLFYKLSSILCLWQHYIYTLNFILVSLYSLHSTQSRIYYYNFYTFIQWLFRYMRVSYFCSRKQTSVLNCVVEYNIFFFGYPYPNEHIHTCIAYTQAQLKKIIIYLVTGPDIICC